MAEDVLDMYLATKHPMIPGESIPLSGQHTHFNTENHNIVILPHLIESRSLELLALGTWTAVTT